MVVVVVYSCRIWKNSRMVLRIIDEVYETKSLWLPKSCSFLFLSLVTHRLKA